ncbi:MAG: hypothetical protein JGK17_32530 [Microcoleus sp. PH2017_10_PVI_O_A]|uniref:hypothetical protein n=1 Tax=unclassified Microcoleus TaxID=2642155 RepID=UPI001D23AAA3|nr:MULTISPECIES: hypothetical protein [unclassified Microcoleus]MCC3410173.1 hypothetical protein [Microcoleus sp. PH2017_10_PVI_O_A]MCC3464436.1 hypothetical protein [Microcoleus sp. PH2017_11_PCY_U_A]MCC3476508.1 hypothetical protein [Microcoleus sp. PH2017_12_PCY_D_A]MCC3530158.1 hypothetical protein [Microcoleus sp. PH2017_21_RUC_O_A]
MTETDAKSETQTTWRDKGDEGIRIDPDSSQDAGRTSEGVWAVGLELHRENCSERDFGNDPLGGILDQLIDDAQKQLVKSQECVVWYQSEAKEVRDKLENLKKLRELRRKELQGTTTTEESDERS